MFNPGDNVGGYTIVRCIGRGGMGEVFLAKHRVLGRQVAIKVLLPEVLGKQSLVSRFLDEARATMLIDHPTIVDVLDCDFLPDGRVYIVMELLYGANLRELLRLDPPLSSQLELSCALLGQVAQGLHKAHERQIVHRDVKPENIFLATYPPDNRTLNVKILDFGIAKLLRPEQLGTLTRTGAVLGTPQYMSPEQCRGERELDHRSDIYSLGCVAFELFANRRVFEADSLGMMLVAQVTEVPPRLAQVAPDLPRPICSLVDAMLAKNPSQRPASMVEVTNSLCHFLQCGPEEFGQFLEAPANFAMGSRGSSYPIPLSNNVSSAVSDNMITPVSLMDFEQLDSESRAALSGAPRTNYGTTDQAHTPHVAETAVVRTPLPSEASRRKTPLLVAAAGGLAVAAAAFFVFSGSDESVRAVSAPIGAQPAPGALGTAPGTLEGLPEQGRQFAQPVEVVQSPQATEVVVEEADLEPKASADALDSEREHRRGAGRLGGRGGVRPGARHRNGQGGAGRPLARVQQEQGRGVGQVPAAPHLRQAPPAPSEPAEEVLGNGALNGAAPPSAPADPYQAAPNTIEDPYLTAPDRVFSEDRYDKAD